MKSASAIPRAFTLIELLIVVAIIAILAAIAVPNFLEAQTRAKLSRATTDMRTIATGVESYRVDNNGYPEYAVVERPATTIKDPADSHGQDYFEHLSRQPGLAITSPIAYLTTIPPDPFVKTTTDQSPRDIDYSYKNSRQNHRIFQGDRAAEPWLGANGEILIRDWGEWRLTSAGPDGTQILDIKLNRVYDSTNGTLSIGDIVRSQKRADSARK